MISHNRIRKALALVSVALLSIASIFLLNVGSAFASPATTRLGNLDDARTSEVYFYKNYDYYANATYRVLNTSACKVTDDVHWDWDIYDFTAGKSFLVRSGESRDLFEVTFKNIGYYYKNGHSVDLKFYLNYANCMTNDGGMHTVFDYAHGNGTPSSNANLDGSGYDTVLLYTLTLCDGTTGEELPSDISVCYEYNDVDIPSSTCPESIGAWNDNFYSAYIYSSSTVNVATINDNGVAKTVYQGTMPTDDDYSPTTTIIYHGKNNAMFRWSGNNTCGTSLGIRALSPGYPKIAVPKKSVVGANTVRKGDSVSYKIEQNFPYLNTDSSNKPSSLTVEDTFDNVLDVSGVSSSTVSVKQKQNGRMVDVTSNWSFTKSGQSVKFTAKDTSGSKCVDDFVFNISGLKVKSTYTFSGYAKTSDGTCWVVPNKAKTTAVGPVSGTVTQTSNTANVNVKRPVNITYKMTGKYAPANPPSAPAVPSNKYYVGDKYSPERGLSDSTGYYQFSGWYTDKELKNRYTGSVLDSESLVLYGRWIPKPIFTVSKEVSKPQYNINEKAHFTIVVRQSVEGASGEITDIIDDINGKMETGRPRPASLNDSMTLSEAGGRIVKDSITIKKISGEFNGTYDLYVDDNGSLFSLGFINDSFGYNDGLVIEYDVQLGDTKSVNLQGNSYKNIVECYCSAAPPNEQYKNDSATFSVRTPKLTSQKTADKTLIDAGDTVVYTLSTTQTVLDAKAYNVHLRDAIPQELLDLGGTVDVNGITVEFSSGAKNGNPVPTLTGNVLDIATTATLGTNETVTAKVPIKFGKRTNVMSGKSFQNQLTGVSDNASSTPVNATVSVSNPVMTVDKSSEKTKVNTSEANTYTLVIGNDTDNALAYGSKVTDALSHDAIDNGAYIDEGSIRVSDNADGTGDSLVNGYQVFLDKRVNGKVTGFDVTLPNDKGQSKDQKWYVTYTVIAGGTDSTGLYDTSINNTAEACCANGTTTAQDDNKVELYTPSLKIVKEVGASTVNVGEDIPYTITVEQLAQGAVAWNVAVRDALATDFVKNGAAYKRDTLHVYDATGVDKTSACKVIYSNDGSGFVVSSPINLAFNQKMRLTYSVICGKSSDASLQGKEWKNVAIAGADNTISEVTDEAGITVRTPALVASKTVDKQFVNCGDEVLYTLSARQSVSGAKAYNVVLTDELPFDVINEGGVVDTQRIVVKHNGSVITPKSIEFSGTTLKILTGATLDGSADTLSADVPVTIGKRNGALDGKMLHNTLIVSSDNAQPATSGVDVGVSITKPSIVKNAAKDVVNLGDTNTYTLNVGNDSDDGSKAYDISIRDSLDDNSAANGARVTSAPVVRNDAGKDITDDFSLSWTDSTAFGNTAFELHTDGPLSSDDHYNVSYQVKNGEIDSTGLYDTGIDNTAIVAFGANTATVKLVRDDADVIVAKPALAIEKSVDNEHLNIGEDAEYTIIAKQTSAGASAINPVISDSLQSGFIAAGGSYLRDSLHVADAAGADVTGKCSINWNSDGGGFSVSYNGALSSDNYLKVVYKVHFGSTTSVGLQGRSWTNTAIMSSPNATDSVSAEATVSVYKPSISAQKTVDKQYANVDDVVTYTLLATSSGSEGSIAYNIVFNDAFPSEFFTSGAKIDMDGISVVDSSGNKVDRQVSMNGSTLIVKTRTALKSGERLEAHVPVKLGNKSSSDLCGNAYKNSLLAQSDNAGTATADAIVNIYKPDLSIVKSSDKRVVNTSDRIDYDVVVTNNKAGSIAYGAYIDDALSPDSVIAGAFIDETTLHVKDHSGRDVTSEADVTWTRVDGNKATGVKIVMKDPFTFAGGETLTLVYQVVAGNTDSTGLFESGIKNSVKCGSSNGLEGGRDENKVTLYTPVLKITKEADKKVLNTGDEAKYTLTVEQLTNGAKAWNAHITDALSDRAFNAGAFIIPWSVAIADGDKQDITNNETTTISYFGKASDDSTEDIEQASGFDAKTAAVVEYGKPVVATYTVRFGGNDSIDLAGMDVENIATADADNNIWQAKDEELVSIYKPVLTVEKGSDASNISQGDEANYLISASQEIDGAIAHDIGLTDIMPYVGNDGDISVDQVASSVEFRLDGENVDLERISDDETMDNNVLIDNDETAMTGYLSVNDVTLSAEEFRELFNIKSDDESETFDSNKEVDDQTADSLDNTVSDASREQLIKDLKNNIKDIKDNKIFSDEYLNGLIDTADNDGAALHVMIINVRTGLDLEYGSSVSMNYSVLLGNLPEQKMINGVIAHAGNAENAYDDAMFDITTPELSIDKSVDASNPLKPIYTIKVSQTVEGANAKQVKIVDDLADETVKAGFFIEDGITVYNSLGDDITEKCTIEPKRDSVLFGKIIGYEISYPDALHFGDQIVIQYVGNASKLGYGITDIDNVATASAWNVSDDVSDDASYNYDGGVEDEIQETGDDNDIVGLLAVLVGIASASGTAAIWMKRRRSSR